MHELSIAKALLDNVLTHCPADSRVVSVRLHIGPSRAIEPELLRSAWRAISCVETHCAGSELEIQLEAWQLRCRSCGREFRAKNWDCACECGGKAQLSLPGQEMWIESLEVCAPAAQALEVRS